MDENDIESLDTLRRDITDAYAKGKISEQHYTLLNKKIPTTEENKVIDNNKIKQETERDDLKSKEVNNDNTLRRMLDKLPSSQMVQKKHNINEKK